MGFLRVKNEAIFYRLVEEFAKKPTAEKEDTLSPFLALAPYQKTNEEKNVDKLSGTYEKDPLFQAFKESIEAPQATRESAEKVFATRE